MAHQEKLYCCTSSELEANDICEAGLERMSAFEQCAASVGCPTKYFWRQCGYSQSFDSACFSDSNWGSGAHCHH
eukprot:12269237-Karenia_brevis.AAC.1